MRQHPKTLLLLLLFCLFWCLIIVITIIVYNYRFLILAAARCTSHPAISKTYVRILIMELITASGNVNYKIGG
jgi:cell division protein FtsL